MNKIRFWYILQLQYISKRFMPKKKYMKILFSLPEETYKEFIKVAPLGERSQIIVQLIAKYLSGKSPQKTEKFDWNELKKYRKGDYSKEDPVTLSKNAWKFVD